MVRLNIQGKQSECVSKMKVAVLEHLLQNEV